MSLVTPSKPKLAGAIRQLISNWRAPRKFRCPVCERSVRRFVPLSDYYRDSMSKHGFRHTLDSFETLNVSAYACPRCSSSDRDRLCALYLRRELARWEPSPKRLFIDFAPSQPLAKLIQSFPCVRYRSADLMMEGVDDKVDLMDLHVYANNNVEGFNCSHVLEHVPDDHKALQELYRILKPGGWGLLLVPISLAVDQTLEDPAKVTEAERWQFFGQGDHLRLYAKKDFTERIRRVGFSLSQLGVADFGEAVFEQHGISPQSVLYVVKKAFEINAEPGMMS